MGKGLEKGFPGLLGWLFGFFSPPVILNFPMDCDTLPKPVSMSTCSLIAVILSKSVGLSVFTNDVVPPSEPEVPGIYIFLLRVLICLSGSFMAV